MKNRTETTISTSVMNQIKSGKIQMRKRSYYTLLGILSVGVVLLASISIAYLSNIIFFWIRIQTADTMAYGARVNLSQSIASFPWLAVVFSVLLLVVAAILVRKQGQMYKHKISTIILIVVAVSLLFGFGLSFFNIDGSRFMNQMNNYREGKSQNWQKNH